MGRQAHAQAAYDIGQRIRSKTQSGSKISDSYMAKLNKSHTKKSKKKPALSRDAWMKSDAKGRGMGAMEYMQRGYGGGYSKYLKDHKKGPTAPRGKEAINRDWFRKSGQSQLLGKKGATLVFRDTVKTWKEQFPHGMGPGPKVWEQYLKSKGQVPGQYTYSTMTYAKDYSYNEAKADREAQAYHSKKSRKKSGIGGILGAAIQIGKGAFKNPKRLLTGIDPISTKLWNEVTGSDDKPLITQMGGPSQKTYQDYTKETGRKVSTGTRTFFKAADAIAGVVGGVMTAGVLAPLATTSAGGLTAAQVAAGGVQTFGGAVAGGATSGAIMGAANVAGTGTEDVGAMFKGAAMGGLTGALKGGFGQLSGMSEAAAAKSRAAQAAASGGKDMSLWDSATSYFTNDSGGADWGNILGAAGKAASIYGQFQGASAQKKAAKRASDVAQEQYGISRDQQQKQFGLAEETLALRMAQQQATNKERGQVRSELRGNLKGGRADLASGYKSARGDLNRGLSELRYSRGQSRNALQPMIGESDAARSRQMGLLGIAGGDRNATLEQSAGYKFRQEEAMRGAERGLAGTGGSRSGRAAIELQQRSEGLAGQYFDTHMGQLGQFAQAGIGARNNLAGLEQGYGNSMAQGRAGLAGLATQYGQNKADQNLGYSQLQSGLVPGSDNFNSQFGQMNPMMGAQVGSTAGAVGQSQSNMSNMIGGGMSLLGSAFGQGGIFNNSGSTGYSNSSKLGSSQAGYGSGYMNAWAGGQ